MPGAITSWGGGTSLLLSRRDSSSRVSITIVNSNEDKNKIINMRKFFKDVWIGLKFAFKVPSLPESISRFHNYALTRIFRVLGGISIVLFLSCPSWIGNYFTYWIIFIFAMSQFLYILIISVIKICYIIYLWKNKKIRGKKLPLESSSIFNR